MDGWMHGDACAVATTVRWSDHVSVTSTSCSRPSCPRPSCSRQSCTSSEDFAVQYVMSTPLPLSGAVAGLNCGLPGRPKTRNIAPLLHFRAEMVDSRLLLLHGKCCREYTTPAPPAWPFCRFEMGCPRFVCSTLHSLCVCSALLKAASK